MCHDDKYPENEQGWIRYYECPNRLIDSGTYDLANACRWARNGILPVVGGSLDQAKIFMDALDVYNATMADLEEEFRRERSSGAE